jgi:Thioredoxin
LVIKVKTVHFCRMKESNLNQYWEKGYTYVAFRALMHELHGKKMVTGPNQSDDLLAYSILNEQRMNRIDKHGSIQDVSKSSESLRILVITEGWCGDSAQILPYMEKWSAAKGHQLRIVLRDENLDLMDQYLTNGARAVPMFLFLNNEGAMVTRWGARPEALQNMVVNWKKEGLTKEVFVTMIHKWYADDKGMTCVQEWEELSFTH